MRFFVLFFLSLALVYASDENPPPNKHLQSIDMILARVEAQDVTAKADVTAEELNQRIWNRALVLERRLRRLPKAQRDEALRGLAQEFLEKIDMLSGTESYRNAPPSVVLGREVDVAERTQLYEAALVIARAVPDGTMDWVPVFMAAVSVPIAAGGIGAGIHFEPLSGGSLPYTFVFTGLTAVGIISSVLGLVGILDTPRAIKDLLINWEPFWTTLRQAHYPDLPVKKDLRKAYLAKRVVQAFTPPQKTAQVQEQAEALVRVEAAIDHVVSVSECQAQAAGEDAEDDLVEENQAPLLARKQVK